MPFPPKIALRWRFLVPILSAIALIFSGAQVLGQTPVSSTAQISGQSWSGSRGVQKTTAEIMADPAARALRQHIYLKREHEIPGRESRPQDGSAPQESHWPLRSGQRTNAVIPNVATVFSGQTIATTFDGVTGPTQTGSFPPDSMGAVGPSQFLIFVNGRLRTFNKTTGHADGALEANPDVFFGSVMTPVPGSGDNFTTDPQVRYDRLSGRWILTTIDVPSSSSNNIGDLPNRILIAVSDAASAGVISGSTVWTFYFVQQNTVGGFNTGEALDYDSLGVDNNALYVGGNMFDAASGSLVTTSAFVIRKSSVLSGGPIVATAFRGLLSGGDGPDSPRGVDNSDSAATEGYIIGSSDATFGRLVLRRVSNPGGTPTISANIPITVNSTAEPITVDHLGNTGGFNGRLDGLDDRLFAAQIRNHRLWTAHNIAVTSAGVASGSDSQRRNAARWYELDVPVGSGAPAVVQSGTVFDSAAAASSARQYWVPSVAVSGQGHAALGFSTAGTSFRVNAATAGRLATDTLGTLSAPTLFTTSNSAYNPSGDSGNGNGSRRWGDYSFTSVDPNDDMTMWTVQEFCDGSNTYGLEVAKLIAPPPATPSSASSSIAGGQSSVNVTITGTSVSGSGFFDPGAGFARRMAASVSGGAIVNSVTYVDATHVTLNLNTVSASAGAQNVTITNPDGQAQTGNGILTVGAGSPSPTPTPTATPTPTPTPTPSPTPTPTATPSPTPTATPISTVATPVISPNGGSYRRKVFITLNCSTPAATIYYTLDGSTPTTTSQVFQSELKLTSSATLKAKAIKTGYQDSAVATAPFVVKRRR